MIFTEAYDFATSFAAFLNGFSVFFTGISIVFVALFLLIFLITVVGKCVTALEKKTKKTDVKVAKPITQVVPEQTLLDDKELVAVITSAICATLGTTSDQLIVRSLRQVNTRIK